MPKTPRSIHDLSNVGKRRKSNNEEEDIVSEDSDESEEIESPEVQVRML